MKKLISIVGALALLATISSSKVAGNPSDFTGQNENMPWLEFVRTMDKDPVALIAFADHLTLAAANITTSDPIADFLANPISNNLALAVTDENGEGQLLFAAGRIDITTGKTVTFNHTSTFTTTDSQVYTFPTTTATLARTDAANTFTGVSTATSWNVVSPVVTTGLTASGSAANTFAGSTGTFVTSTGANTLSGDVSVAAGKDIVYAAGDGVFDGALGTGIFTTTTGANTLSGDVTVAAGKDITYGSGDGKFDASLGTGIYKTTTGLNTVGGKQALKVIATPVAATGTDASGAAPLGSANIITISSDGAGKGVILVAGVAGDVVHLLATTATAALLYPATGGTINGLSANAPVVIPASTGLILICTATNTWIASDMAARATSG